MTGDWCGKTLGGACSAPKMVQATPPLPTGELYRKLSELRALNFRSPQSHLEGPPRARAHLLLDPEGRTLTPDPGHLSSEWERSPR